MNRSGSILLMVLSWMSLLCASASASTTEDFTAGMRLYQSLEYEQARPLLRAAMQSPELDASERAQAGLTLAIVELALGEEAQAAQTIEVALRLDPNVDLGSEVSPAVRQLVLDARAKLAADSPADIGSATAPNVVDKQNTVGHGNPQKSDVETRAQASKKKEVETETDSILQQWWFWTIGGGVAIVAVVATATAIYFMLNQNGSATVQVSPSQDSCESGTGSGCVVVTF